MKKFLMILVLILVAGSVFAETIIVEYRDSLSAADTVSVRSDTVRSPWFDMGTGRFLTYGVKMASGVTVAGDVDTNWIDDSLFFQLELAFGSQAGATIILEIDTLVANGSTIGVNIYDADATVLPQYGRFVVIHWDSIGNTDIDAATDDTLVVGNVYPKQFTLWYNWR